jgi:hypothetical protein
MNKLFIGVIAFLLVNNGTASMLASHSRSLSTIDFVKVNRSTVEAIKQIVYDRRSIGNEIKDQREDRVGFSNCSLHIPPGAYNNARLAIEFDKLTKQLILAKEEISEGLKRRTAFFIKCCSPTSSKTPTCDELDNACDEFLKYIDCIEPGVL